MTDHCFVVLDAQGRRLAGPFTEQMALGWVSLNRHRYPRPFAIACTQAEWNPLARFDSVEGVPQAVWMLQAGGELIVVAAADRTAAVYG